MTPYDILPSIYRQLRAVGVDPKPITNVHAYAPLDRVNALSFYVPLTRDNAVGILRGIISITDADDTQATIAVRSLLQVVASQWDSDEASEAITAWRKEICDED